MPKPPFAPLDFAPAEIETEMQADGSQVLRSPQVLDDYPPKLGLLLERWAAEAPDRTFLAERDGDGWREVSYGAALQSVRALGTTACFSLRPCMSASRWRRSRRLTR
jgi:feruloyl-CoA synthase